MKNFDFDLLIIGAGSGGVRAARVAAGLGFRVGIAEKSQLGGTCVNVGCVPKKLLVYASRFAEEFTASQGYGWNAEKAEFNWQTLITNKNVEIQRLNTIYKKLLDESGVQLITGEAMVTDINTVCVGNRSYSAKTILIATGAWPSMPEIPGNELAISSNEAFFLKSLPEKIVIVGGGYIGVEFAGIFNALGVDTTLVYRGPLILKGFDDEARKFLTEEIQKKGIKLLVNTTVSSITEIDTNSLRLQLSDMRHLDTEIVMYATGRHPNTSGLGLETLGVKLDGNGAIIIDAGFQSSVSSVYAIGDVTNRYNLTPVAIAEGMAFAHSLYGETPMPVNYQDIPTSVFSQPNFATVGLSEEEAKKQYTDVSVFTNAFTHLKHSLSGIAERTFMKLLVDKKSDRVVGAHMIGEDAGEIIQGIAIAMKAGARKADFDSTIAIHPTAAEEFVTMRQPTR